MSGRLKSARNKTYKGDKKWENLKKQKHLLKVYIL